MLYNNLHNKSGVLNAIDQIQYVHGSSNIADALYKSRFYMFTGSNGDRPNVPNAIVLVSEGESNIDTHLTLPEAMVSVHTIQVFFKNNTYKNSIHKVINTSTLSLYC